MNKPLVILAATTVLLLLSACEKDRLDAQVKELCAKDGGIKVYETVKLPPEKFDKYGVVRIPFKQDAKPSDQYYYESRMHHYKSGNPEMWQLHFVLYRRIDNKLLGEAISYARRGGDLPGPWHASSFGCPDDADISDLKKRIFIKAD
ncbi:MAG: hypothetical protein R3E40_03515 [Rhodocyclaceae bacterium]